MGGYRFGAESPHRPRVEFDVRANFIGPINDYYATELIVNVTNKGLKRKTFDQILASVRGLKENETLEEWKGKEPRLYLPHKLIDKAELVYKSKYGSIFVEPTVSLDVTYFSRIPSDIKLISIRAEFKYNFGKSHSAEKLIEVNTAHA